MSLKCSVLVSFLASQKMVISTGACRLFRSTENRHKDRGSPWTTGHTGKHKETVTQRQHCRGHDMFMKVGRFKLFNFSALNKPLVTDINSLLVLVPFFSHNINWLYFGNAVYLYGSLIFGSFAIKRFILQIWHILIIIVSVLCCKKKLKRALCNLYHVSASRDDQSVGDQRRRSDPVSFYNSLDIHVSLLQKQSHW